MWETWVWSLGWEDSPGEGKGYPLQHSSLENSMVCIVHGVTKSRTRLSDWLSLSLIGEPHGICLSLTLWLCMTLSRSIHMVADGEVSFFFLANTPHVYVPRLHLCLCWWILKLLPHLAVVNSAAMNSLMRCIYLSKLVFSFFFFSDEYPGVEMLDHMIVLFLIFCAVLLFSTVSVPIYIPTDSVLEFPFLHILVNTCYLLSFWWWPFWLVWGVIPHCGCGLHFPNHYWCWASFLVPVGHLYVFFGKMSIQALSPFLNWIVLSDF